MNSARLQDLARGRRKITVVIPDLTRRAGVSSYLPLVLAHLLEGGCDEAHITVLVALGIHRPMTDVELKAHVGERVWGRFTVLNHDPDRADGLVQVGKTPGGLKVVLNRLAVDADLLVLTGGVTYHYFAGYGGGRKTLLPGVASRAACEAHHRLVVEWRRGRLKGDVAPGRLEGNPVAEEMASACAMVPAAFNLSVVTSPDGSIVAACAGEVIESHRAACVHHDRFYLREIPEAARFVVASAGGWPKDINMVQAHKGLYSAHRAVSPDGVVLLLASCTDGTGHPDFLDWFRTCSTEEQWLHSLETRYQINGQTAYSVWRRTQANPVLLVSRMDPESVRLMGMVPCADLEEAMDSAESILGELPPPLVMPDAGDILVKVGGNRG